jgi:hypothetical protein
VTRREELLAVYAAAVADFDAALERYESAAVALEGASVDCRRARIPKRYLRAVARGEGLECNAVRADHKTESRAAAGGKAY